TPSSVPGLGYDNSIFIDDDDTWYLLVKNGQVNNWIVQLGNDGQPSGAIYNLTWINPSPSYPFSWAEGPVMWKNNGFYYYSFALNVAGGEKILRSYLLTDSASAWINMGDFFNLNDPQKSTAVFNNPNHNSAAVMIGNGTSWIMHPLWRNGNNNEWYGQGRQGLLNQVTYDANTTKPTADYPVNVPRTAPKLPSSGIPWMVPHSDFFTSQTLNPEWSFSGYAAANTYSLTSRPGWLALSPRGREYNTVIKNDGEHNYSLMTKMDFAPTVVADQAGLWVFNGLQSLFAKLCSTVDSAGEKVIAMSFNGLTQSTLNTAGDTVWLKLVRVNHILTGYWSADGFNWTKVGAMDVTGMDGLQANYNSWTGNRQGLFVQNKTGYFNLYIYRDAYTPILAECPANQFGTTRTVWSGDTTLLDNIYNNNWAMYAGVEFGGNGFYPKTVDSLHIVASSATEGGTVEAYIDSIDESTKFAECSIVGTGAWGTFKTFSTKLLTPVSGHHDVYLLFTGTPSVKLFMLQSLYFSGTQMATGVSGDNFQNDNTPHNYQLEQNYPNPFNPTTRIEYSIPRDGSVSLKVYNLLGRTVATLFAGKRAAGNYAATFDGSDLASGVYFYRLNAGSFAETKKLVLLK
ncbi:MAG TPA: T9SS type A sorting domain-containing protein, partial [Bacteroidota bacterium]|nr:T9SS type A sorting domain-containing protein [Bacteroidota bacterium]